MDISESLKNLEYNAYLEDKILKKIRLTPDEIAFYLAYNTDNFDD